MHSTSKILTGFCYNAGLKGFLRENFLWLIKKILCSVKKLSKSLNLRLNSEKNCSAKVSFLSLLLILRKKFVAEFATKLFYLNLVL